ncbi:DUF2530 domain-containing protein [Xylanimonas sp. McL0601]|uniref:DUF2530 domain-containing protein n=1 Tax=Xylanimonas sp. McL0601 TaxID=3414739 RepID=UPI003CFAA610
MPSLVRLLTRPETRRPGPPPLAVDLPKVLLAGIAVWVVALVVTVVLVLTGVQDWTAVAVCGAGLVLGGLGLLWARRHR